MPQRRQSCSRRMSSQNSSKLVHNHVRLQVSVGDSTGKGLRSSYGHGLCPCKNLQMQQAGAPLLAALQHMLEQAMPLVLLVPQDTTVSGTPVETMVWVPSGQPPHPAVDWARTEAPRSEMHNRPHENKEVMKHSKRG